MGGYVKVGGTMVAVAAVIAAILAGGDPPGGGGEPTPTPTPTATATSTSTATPTPVSCDRNATTGTFSAQISAATAGQVVCLAAGDYGTWTGVTKGSPGVTIRPADGAEVEMTLNFNQNANASWLILDGIDIDSDARSQICAPTNNVTIRNGEVRRELDIIARNSNVSQCGSSSHSMNNNNIVLEYMNFSLADDPDGSELFKEGRLSFIDGHASNPAGVQVAYSMFDGGPGNGRCGDFIQFANNADDNSGRGVTIGPGNTFRNMIQEDCDDFWPGGAPHSDAIQGVGMAGVTITGNYFHDNTTGIINYDYITADVVVEQNVLVDIDHDAIWVGGGTDNIIRHNTLVNAPAGNSTTHHTPGSVNTTYQDNILEGPITNQGTSTFLVNDRNWCIDGTCTGTNPLNGDPEPDWVGGAAPTTYEGFALEPGSRGTNAASDGTDIGVNP